jgi:MFS family permease
MALLGRVYFNAIFGALGGLIGWMLFGLFGHRAPAGDEVQRQLVIGGAFIGGAIGYFLVGADALRDHSLLRFLRLASYGVVLGLAGGALGMWAGDQINTWLVGRTGSVQHGGARALLVAALARGLGWMLLGMAVGISEGIAARSLGKLSYGTAGGALGGFVGGALYGLALQGARGGDALFWGALGLIILGACIGSLSALVQAVFQPACVRVLRGWQEGREYPLDKNENLLGRDEHADIALFRDMRVEKRHALIRREGRRFVLRNNHAPVDFTRVNDEPVADRRDLRDGDRIQLGNVLLRFQSRAARGKKVVGRQ